MAKRIVIIEDDKNIMELLVYLFEDEGYHVTSFTTGKDAAYIAKLAPNLVLLDINLSGSEKNGDAICSDIKNLPDKEKLQVILLSAEKNLESLALSSGAHGFLAKPFDIDSLISKVKALER